jgi:nucleotide-binding universal stress UspA family protein
MAIRKILIAIDGEPIAAHAAEMGFELAQSLGAEVALIYGVDPNLAYAPQSGVSSSQLIAEAERDGRRLLASVAQHSTLQSRPLEFVQSGKPSAEIVKAAAEWPADLIVIGSHGRRGIERALLGSVAEAVLRHAPCPVLVVPGKE